MEINTFNDVLILLVGVLVGFVLGSLWALDQFKKNKNGE